jgi:transposase-like protein
MAKRGVVLIYETVREWCFKLGRIYAKRMRSRNCPSENP